MRRNPASRAISAIALIGAILYANPSPAQVKTSITSSGLGTAVAPPPAGQTDYQITGGARQGPNLFHSFGLFSVGEGDTASFRNATPGVSTSNIVSRVTGGEPSNVFGTIDTLSYPGANLYLVNPAGVIFGPNARLDVGGSFHASTADYLRFADGAKFYANLSQNSVLTIARPEAFGFLGPTPPARLIVQGSSLQVPNGQTLSLVGGDVMIQTPSSLNAPNGRIQIVALGSAGEVQLSTSDGTPNLKLVDVSTLGRVDLSEAPSLAAGNVLIRGSLSGSVPDGHIVLDGSLGTGGSLLPVAFDETLTLRFFIPAESGQQRGANLFHSFSRFDLYANESATFQAPLVAPPTPISNILARITGGEQSFIDGTIGTDIAGANLFFLNPAGVLFGPTAALNVPGAFHVSTATSLAFADRFEFSATPPPPPYDPNDPPVLSSDSPVSFGFVGPNPAAISILGSVLQVQTGQTLSVVGGDVQISGARLAAPGGRVQIASVIAGKVTISGPEQALNVDPAASLGQIDIADNSFIGTSNPDTFEGGGIVLIRGGRLVVTGSQILAPDIGDVEGPRLIDIQILGDLVLRNGASIQSLTLPEPGGDVRITADSLQMEGAAFIQSVTFGDFKAGDITVTARNVTLQGGAQISTSNNAAFFGVVLGAGGSVTVTATDAVTLSGNVGDLPSGLVSDTSSRGAGGPITVSANKSLTMADGATITSRSFGDGTGELPFIPGGDITVTAPRVSITGLANITSRAAGNGAGGNVAVKAADSLVISDRTDQAQSGIFTGSSGDGPAGSISIGAGSLTLTHGGFIQSGTFLDPQAGDIAIDATDSVVISDNGAVLSQASSKDIGQVSLHAHTLTMDNGFIQTSTIQSGRAGDVSVTVDDQMTLVNGGKIISSSLLSASGKGGTINVTAGGAIVIAGRSNTSPPSELFVNDASSGLFSTTASPDPLGSAGKVVVTAPTLTIADHGKISVESTGVAPAGDISLTLGTLTLSGGAGLFSNATSSGPGGNINVQAEQVQLASGATISASSSGTGLAGSVTIQATTFQTQDSFVTTEATQADGGDIDILVGSLVYLTGSEITTSVGKGAGKGGNITIDPQFVVLNNSQILANAFGGPGGNITIVADVFLSSGSILSASSALSAPGTISIDARITDLSDSLVQLPDNVLQAANLLRTACTARVAEGKASSLVVAGREGVPPEPEGLLWSPLGATLTDLSATPREAQERERLPRFAGVWLVSNCAR